MAIGAGANLKTEILPGIYANVEIRLKLTEQQKALALASGANEEEINNNLRQTLATMMALLGNSEEI